MVRGAGCREPNPRIPHREKNVLDMPSYRSGDYTQNRGWTQTTDSALTPPQDTSIR